MTSLLVIFPDAERSAEFLTFLDLRFGKFVHLMLFQAARTRPSQSAILSLSFELLAQRSALVVDFIFIDAADS